MRTVILGSDGFVGKNLFEDLSDSIECCGSTRRIENLSNKNTFFFDLTKEETWIVLLEIKPDCIINCIVGGVVKRDEDVKESIDFNYLQTQKFYLFLKQHLPSVYLIHLGTAFEYDLEKSSLTESTICNPKTYYGISKYLISNSLLNKELINQFTIIRPFNLFGPYDQTNKIIPYLISNQINKTVAELSEGDQKRDYLFIKDLSKLINCLIESKEYRKNKIINAGSGKVFSIKEIANILASKFDDFDSSLWQWGKLPYRQGESTVFYNGSTLAADCGMQLTNLDAALDATINYYLSLKEYSTQV